jgi:hypothetical protein
LHRLASLPPFGLPKGGAFSGGPEFVVRDDLLRPRAATGGPDEPNHDERR